MCKTDESQEVFLKTQLGWGNLHQSFLESFNKLTLELWK